MTSRRIGKESARSGAEDLLELERSSHLELVVAAILRASIRTPALEHRSVPEALALHVVVLHFADALDAQRLPRQVLAGAPPALSARHSLNPGPRRFRAGHLRAPRRPL